MKNERNEELLRVVCRKLRECVCQVSRTLLFLRGRRAAGVASELAQCETVPILPPSLVLHSVDSEQSALATLCWELETQTSSAGFTSLLTSYTVQTKELQRHYLLSCLNPQNTAEPLGFGRTDTRNRSSSKIHSQWIDLPALNS